MLVLAHTFIPWESICFLPVGAVAHHKILIDPLLAGEVTTGHF
jgi:hypothetical protein